MKTPDRAGDRVGNIEASGRDATHMYVILRDHGCFTIMTRTRTSRKILLNQRNTRESGHAAECRRYTQ